MKPLSDMTRSRVICGVCGVVGLAALICEHFHWPAGFAAWSQTVAVVALSFAMIGLRGITQALHDKKIDAALKDHPDG